MDDSGMSTSVMDWAEWQQCYRAIVADFGFDVTADRAARDELAELVAPAGASLEQLPLMTDATVAIVGGSPALSATDVRIRDADVIIAASQAGAVLEEAGESIDIMVTDLDGAPETAVSLTKRNVPVMVHAHGDNRESLERWVPQMDVNWVVPSTQVRPKSHVVNVGGFTDGDRAAFLAAARQAQRLTFPGWDLDDETVGPQKRQKLRWAERLLYWLERRRDDRFDVLDGRRDDIDLAGLPTP